MSPQSGKTVVRKFSRFTLACLTLVASFGAWAQVSTDPFEQNDTQESASPIWSVDPTTIFSGLPDALQEAGIPQVHWITDAQDVDWLVFFAKGNEWHEVHVSPQTDALDLRVEIFDAAGNASPPADWNFAGEPETLSYYLDGPSQMLWIRIQAMDFKPTQAPQTYKVSVYQPYLEFDGYVFGSVTDAETGRPVVGAQVESPRGSGVLALENGAYLMPHVAGQFTFEAAVPSAGYRPITEVVEIEALSYTERNFRLNGGSSNGDATQNSGTISLSVAKVVVSEAQEFVNIEVQRNGGTEGAASVRLKTEAGSARTQEDFTPVSQQLHWGDGDGAPRMVNIPLRNDPFFEKDESFRVVLESPQGSALGGWRIATIMVEDDDPRRPSVYIEESGELLLRDLRVNGDRVEARLAAQGDRFRLVSTGPAVAVHERPAQYYPQSGQVEIPYLEVQGSQTAYRARIELVGRSPHQFRLSELTRIGYSETGF